MVRPKKSKLRGSQWSFYQLRQLILYQAALSGIVFEVTSTYTSQECSRCHKRTKPQGKQFSCKFCGHNDHRDATAAFTLAERVMPVGGTTLESGPRSGSIGDRVFGNRSRSLRDNKSDD
jgi:transposase